MATKAYQKGLRKRLESLVDEAGGTQTDFIRRVWPRSDVAEHKGKVNRWLKGKNGIRPDEAKLVAERFDRRPAWLLLGEMPERPDLSRSLSSLSDDVSREVILRALHGQTYPAWLSGMLGEIVWGEHVLSSVAEELRSELDANATWFEQRNEVARQLQSLRNSIESGAPMEPDGILKILENLYAAPPPSGRYIKWGPVSFKGSDKEVSGFAVQIANRTAKNKGN